MASIKKNDKGYRVQVQVKHLRESKTFATRREATEWAFKRENEFREQIANKESNKFTLKDALRRYSKEISPTKRGIRWEQIRLAAFEERNLPLEKFMCDVDNDDIALYRDSRLKEVSGASVLRELNLLSSVFEIARIEWRWCEKNPVKEIRKPRSPKHRERVLSWYEIRAMLKILGYKTTGKITSNKQAVAICMLVALRTGMRAGELCGLEWSHVFERHVHLPLTKNGNSRNVPLSNKAKGLIERMRGVDDVLVFGMTSQTLSSAFKKQRQRAGLSGFTWHDTRHTAATMLSKKLKVLDLCKMFGWSDPKMAMVYYNPHASSLADYLN
ncbi:tyrosine-type recombinase/integrase [Thorsellia anophelis]|uniref:Phage integrase family protein n=1 Tax=Thorsellia anophelis DSM 18579 TaxID=1123402 RepID=A0A1I0CBU4_9GAMM|nr:site-specific integrase [Thorsellia anophelis]SET16592.1 Phage integrase family protein [Thorsellia anophelis DSM 18579]